MPIGLIPENNNCVSPAIHEVPDFAVPAGKANTGTPKLSITKKGNKRKVKQGNKVRFTIHVKNTGTAAAKNVRVCDILPAGMVYVSHTKKALFERGGRICWTLKFVAKNKTVAVGTVTVSITKSKGKVTNRACIMKGKTTRVAKCANAVVTVIARKPQPIGGVTG